MKAGIFFNRVFLLLMIFSVSIIAQQLERKNVEEKYTDKQHYVRLMEIYQSVQSMH